MALVFPRRTESMCLNGWQRIGIAASVVWAIGAPIFQSISCGRNVAFDNLCVIENELQAAMTNPLLRGPVDLLRPSVHGLASSLRLVAPRSCQRISRPCNDLQCRDSGLVQRLFWHPTEVLRPHAQRRPRHRGYRFLASQANDAPSRL